MIGLCLPPGSSQFVLRVAENHHVLIQLERSSLYSLKDFQDGLIEKSGSRLYNSYRSVFSASTHNGKSILARVKTQESVTLKGIFDMRTTVEFWDPITGTTSIAVETYQSINLTGKRHGNMARCFLKYLGDAHFQLAISSESGSFTFVEDSVMKWTREEALASIKNVAFIDIPASEQELSSLEEEFEQPEDMNMLLRFAHRLTSHIRRVMVRMNCLLIAAR